MEYFNYAMTVFVIVWLMGFLVEVGKMAVRTLCHAYENGFEPESRDTQLKFNCS